MVRADHLGLSGGFGNMDSRAYVALGEAFEAWGRGDPRVRVSAVPGAF